MDEDPFQKQIETGRKALESARQALNAPEDVASTPNAESQILAHKKEAHKPKPKLPEPIHPVGTGFTAVSPTKAPAPPREVGVLGLRSYQPRSTEVPHDLPTYFPSDLWAQTSVILLQAQRKFPLQTQTVELCLHIVSEMTRLFVKAVKAEKMKAANVLREHGGGMADLLHLLLVRNDPGPKSGWGISDAAYRLGQEVKKSDEWLALAEAIERAEAELSKATRIRQRFPSRRLLPSQWIRKMEFLHSSSPEVLNAATAREQSVRIGGNETEPSLARDSSKTEEGAEVKPAAKDRNLSGRPRKDKERDAVRSLKANGESWKDIAAKMNAETGQNKSPEAYRSLLKSRPGPGTNGQK
jgi:hypothetical protein